MIADDIDADGAVETSAPVWAVFGDLMAGLLGAFVLILVCVLGMQFDLAERLKAEVQQHQAEAQRREALERALAIPLAAGRVTLRYVVLRPTLDVSLARATGRGKEALVEEAPILRMYDEFCDLGSYEPFVVDTTDMTAEDSAALVRARVARHEFDLPDWRA